MVNQIPCTTMPIARATRIGAAAWACAREMEGTKAWSAGVASTAIPALARTVNTATDRSPRERSSRTPSPSPAAAFSLMRVNSAVTTEVVTRDCGRM